MRIKKSLQGVPVESLIISALLFFVVLSGLVLFIIMPKATFSDEENRVLQDFPSFSFEDLFDGKYTQKFETYLADQFPARNFFVGINCDAQLMLQKKDVGGVYFGKNNYLFEILTQPDPKILKSNLSGVNSLSKKVDLPIYFMPVPSSAQEMKESLPAYAPSYDQNISMKEIENSLSPNVKIVNVMDTLKPSDGEELYFKTDHHWNVFGAYKGYQVLMQAMGLNPVSKNEIEFEKVASDYYGSLYSKAGYKLQQPDDFYLQHIASPQQISCFSSDKKTDSVFNMSQLSKKDKYTVYIGGNHDKDIIRNDALKTGRVLIIKDSYAHIMVPYLIYNFSEIHLLDLRYFHKDITEYIKDNEFDSIVILYSIKQLDEVVTLGDM